MVTREAVGVEALVILQLLEYTNYNYRNINVTKTSSNPACGPCGAVFFGIAMAILFAPRECPTQLPTEVLAFYFFDHVVDDMAVLTLRTEHDDLRVLIDLYVMSGGPVKKIVRFDRLLRAVCVGCGELAKHDKTPVGALAQIAFQSLKQWCGIDARGKTEVLATNLAKPSCITEIRSLTNHSTWNLHFNVDILFGYPHIRFSYVC